MLILYSLIFVIHLIVLNNQSEAQLDSKAISCGECVKKGKKSRWCVTTYKEEGQDSRFCVNKGSGENIFCGPGGTDFGGQEYRTCQKLDESQKSLLLPKSQWLIGKDCNTCYQAGGTWCTVLKSKGAISVRYCEMFYSACSLLGGSGIKTSCPENQLITMTGVHQAEAKSQTCKTCLARNKERGNNRLLVWCDAPSRGVSGCVPEADVNLSCSEGRVYRDCNPDALRNQQMRLKSPYDVSSRTCSACTRNGEGHWCIISINQPQQQQQQQQNQQQLKQLLFSFCIKERSLEAARQLCGVDGNVYSSCDNVNNKQTRRRIPKLSSTCDGCVQRGSLFGWCVHKSLALISKFCIPKSAANSLCAGGYAFDNCMVLSEALKKE